MTLRPSRLRCLGALLTVVLLGAAAVRAQFVWDGTTTLAASPLGSNTIGGGVTLDITTGNNHDFNATTITNNGTVNWLAGHLRSGNGGAFINAVGATFNDLNASGYSIHNPSFGGTAGTFSFTNSGAYIHNATGTSLLDVPFANNGTVSNLQGDLQFRAGGSQSGTATFTTASGTHVYFTGGFTFANGSALTGAGNFWLTGGTFTAPGALTFGTLTQTAGNLIADGTLTGVFNWNGGDWNAATAGLVTTLGAGTTLNLTAGANYDFNQRGIVNNGTVNWTTGHLRGGNGSTFVNNGTFNDLNASGYSIHNPSFGGSAGTFTFTNNGTYTHNAPNTSYLDVPFFNNGTVSNLQGDLQFRAGGALGATGTINAASGTNVIFTNDYTVANGVSLTGAGTYWVTGGIFTVPGTITVSTLNQTGGNLAGSQTLNGTINWSGGNWNAAATGFTTTLGAGATLNLATGGNYDFNQRGIVNNGIVNWSAGHLRGGNGSTFVNNGTFNDLNAFGYSIHNPSFGGSAGTFAFTNNGTYTHNAPNTSYVDVPFFNNGTVSNLQGDLRIRAGGTLAATGTFSAATGTNVIFTNDYTIASGGALLGAGAYWVTGGTFSVPGTLTFNTLNQTGGNLAGSPTLNGVVNWSGGDWNAASAGFTTTLGAGATLNLATGGNYDFNQRGIVTNGTVNWSAGHLRGGNGSTFVNNGTFNDLNASGYSIHNPSFGGSAGTFTFTNNGTYIHNAPNTSYIDVPFFNNGTVSNLQGDLRIRAGGALAAAGTINAASGTNVIFTNDYTVANGASLTGAGTYWVTGGTFTVPGTITVSTLNQTGGNLAGTQTLNGVVNWSGGDWNAPGSGFTTTLGAGSTLNLTSGGNYDFNQRGIVNHGTVNWSAGHLRGGNGSTFVNNGTFNDLNAPGYTIHNPSFGGSAGTFTFTNNGTYSHNATGTSYVDVPFTNNGTVTNLQGDLQFRAGGTLAPAGTISVARGTSVYFTAGFSVANGASLTGVGDFWLTGGALTLNGLLNAGNFTQLGGALLGTGTFNGYYTWNGGDWNGAATTTVGATGTLNLGNSANHDFNQRAIVNNGTVNWSSGYIRGGNGSTFVNNGTFNDLNAPGYTIHNPSFGGSAGTFVFTNNGTYVRNTTGTTFFDTTFNNPGTVNLQQGEIQVRAGVTLGASSVVNTSSGARFALLSSSTILDGAQFTGAGLVEQTAGTLTIDGRLRAQSFLWSGGNWNAANNSGLTSTIAPGTTLNLTDGSDGYRDFNGRTILNQGVVNWSSGYLRSGNGGAFVNAVGATFNDLNAPGFSIHTAFGGTFSFTNNGTYARNVGGTTYFQAPFNNAGTLNLQQGDIRLEAGGTMGATSVVNVAAPAHLFFTSDYTLLTGATFAGPGLVNQVGGTLTLNGTLAAQSFLWSGGNWNAANNSGLTSTIGSGSTLNLTNAHGEFRDFNGRTILNQGVVNWSAGYLRSGNGGAFVNAAGGVFNDFNAPSYAINADHGGAFSFTNNGTYVRNVGGTTYFQAPFNNAGTLNLQQGDIRLEAGGTMGATSVVNVSAPAHLYFANDYTLQTGATFAGPGLVNQIGGTLTLNGALTAASFLWSGGNWNAANNSGLTSTIGSGSTLNLTNAHGEFRDFNGRTILNQGVVNWSAGYLRSGNGGAFVNAAGGVFNDFNAPGYAIQNPSFNGSAGTFSFTNNGAYVRNVGGTTYFQAPFTNTGTLNLQQGDIRLEAGGSMNAGSVVNVSAGAHLYFANDYAIQTGASFAGPGLVNQIAGTLTLNGTLTAQSFLWSGGNWNAANNSGLTSTIGVGTTLNLANSHDELRDFNGRTILNQGVVNWSSGYLRSGNGGAFVNAAGGVFNDLNSPGYSVNRSGYGGVFTFTNRGAYNKTTGGTTTFDIPFANDGGTVLVTAGSLVFQDQFTQTNNGTLRLVNGATATFSQGLALPAASMLTGTGTLTGNITTAGRVAPGSSPGTLTIAGNLTLQGSSQLIIELGGLGPGGDYDVLAVTGTATLAGGLALTFVNGFGATVNAGNTFTFLTSSGLSGVFANAPTNGARLGTTDGLGSFQVNYGVNNVSLSNFVPVPEPSTWALLLTGLGAVALVARRRTRESARERS